MPERKAVTKELVVRYRKASKGAKGQILDELCALTGWNRDYARRALRQAEQIRGRWPSPKPPPVRAATYGEQVLEPLRFIWATLNGPCGKRLQPFIPEMIEVLERCGELIVASPIKDKLLLISPATIDRKLAPDRAKLKLKGRSGTKPGTLSRGRFRSAPSRSGTRPSPVSSNAIWSPMTAEIPAAISARPSTLSMWPRGGPRCRG